MTALNKNEIFSLKKNGGNGYWGSKLQLSHKHEPVIQRKKKGKKEWMWGGRGGGSNYKMEGVGRERAQEGGWKEG